MPIRANFSQTNAFRQTLRVMGDISDAHKSDLTKALNLRIESIMHFNKFSTEEESIQHIYDNDKNMSEALKRRKSRTTLYLA